MKYDCRHLYLLPVLPHSAKQGKRVPPKAELPGQCQPYGHATCTGKKDSFMGADLSILTSILVSITLDLCLRDLSDLTESFPILHSPAAEG